MSSPCAATAAPPAKGDAVVVVPQQMEQEVVRRALEKVSGKNQSREALQRGEKRADVFLRLGIL